MEKEVSSLVKNFDIQQILDTYIIPWGTNIALAIITYIIGKMIARLVKKIVMKMISRSTQDEMLVNFIGSIVGAVLTLFVIIATLSRLGIDTTSLVALIGAAGLAIGLSLQDSMKNFAAGVMILVFKPFKKGDFVEVSGAIQGVVNKISIFTSVLTTGDNKEVTIPNGTILNAPIVNFSSMPTRRVDMVFGIGYDDNIKEARDIIKNILEEDQRVHKDPEPLVVVGELGDNSVNLTVRAWANTPDYWGVFFSTQEDVKVAFDKAGITIPFPQIDLTMKK